MGKNQSASGLTNIIQYDNNGNIAFVSGSTTLMQVSSSGAITTTGTISGGDAADALLLNGTGSLAFVTTASYNVASASFSSRTTQVERTYATTGSNTFTGAQFASDTSNAISFTSTASLYSDGGLRVQGNSFVSGTAYFNNIIVYGTSSIQYITSSQVNVGTNIITVNTDTPAVRFGGLAVFDSGSTQLTGSMLWDSEKNHWVYSNPSGSTYSGGMFISGPRSSALGSEQGTTACMLLVGQGSDHLTSSMIYHDSTKTCFYSNALYVTSSGAVGIGTNVPTKALEIFSNVSQDGIKISGASNPRLTIIDTTNSVQFDALTTDTEAVLRTDTNHPLHLSTNGTLRLTIASTGAATFACQVCAPSFVSSGTITASQGLITNISGVNVGGYNHYTQTVSGAMGILGHNLRADPSVANQVNVVNGGWISSMIKLYYNEGITFHSNSTMYNAGAVYPFGDTERMRITNNGRIGINDSCPNMLVSLGGSTGRKLHVYNDGAAGDVGGGLGVDLGGFSAETALFFGCWGGAGRFSIGSWSTAACYSTKLTVNANGELLLNTTVGTSADPVHRFGTNGGTTYARIMIQERTGAWISLNTGTTNYGTINLSGGVVVYGGQSDYRLKENIQPLSSGLDRVMNLKPVTFNWKRDSSYGEGFIAHELQEVVPIAVTGTKDGLNEVGDPDWQNVDKSHIVPILVKAIQEQQCKIALLESCLGIS
jgi:hypothetical protein